MSRKRKLDFESLLLITSPVKIGDKTYVLREATGDVSAKYRNAMLACSTLGPDGKPVRMEGLADVDFLLLSMCLFEDGKNHSVPEQEIRTWPNRICEVLIEELKAISGMSETDEDSPKNLPVDTTPGSD